MRRRIAVAPTAIALILGLSLITVVPVLAAVGNDTVSGATPVSIGDTITQDTTTHGESRAASIPAWSPNYRDATGTPEV